VSYKRTTLKITRHINHDKIKGVTSRINVFKWRPTRNL